MGSYNCKINTARLKYSITLTVSINCRSVTGQLGLLLLAFVSLSTAHIVPEPAPVPDDGDSVRKTSEQMPLNSDYKLAELQYQNGWDGPLVKECKDGEGFYGVRSKYAPGRRDRLWEFQCRKVVKDGCATCSKANSYVNNFREAIFFMCGKNEYIGRVESYHDNGQEDRRWKFTCCSAKSQITNNCRLSDYVNSPGQQINFRAAVGEVITGVFSYYKSGTW